MDYRKNSHGVTPWCWRGQCCSHQAQKHAQMAAPALPRRRCHCPTTALPGSHYETSHSALPGSHYEASHSALPGPHYEASHSALPGAHYKASHPPRSPLSLGTWPVLLDLLDASVAEQWLFSYFRRVLSKWEVRRLVLLLRCSVAVRQASDTLAHTHTPLPPPLTQ